MNIVENSSAEPGEVVIFDRSWYNRVGVEHVMGFCTDQQYLVDKISMLKRERNIWIWKESMKVLRSWKGQPPEKSTQQRTSDYFLAGIRIGVGTSVALLVSTLFGFAKLGWAPSGAGLIIGYDTKTSKMLAWSRFVATVGGAALAVLCLFISINTLFLTLMSILFTFLNGLLKATKVGAMPLFYTATILILYSTSSAIFGPTLAALRILYNVIGIAIGLALVLYPFPALAKRLEARLDAAQSKV